MFSYPNYFLLFCAAHLLCFYLSFLFRLPLHRAYMSMQTDINPKMREILIDWLVEVHLKFKLHQETLFLTVNIIDRFLSLRPIQRNKLQLVGCTAMLIAAKYEEIYAPEVQVCRLSHYLRITEFTHNIIVLESDYFVDMHWLQLANVLTLLIFSLACLRFVFLILLLFS